MEKAIQYLTELAERITQNTGVTVTPSDSEELAVDLSIQGDTFAKIFFDTATQKPVYQSNSHTVDSVDEMKNAIEDDLSNSITLNEVKQDDSSYEHDDDITNTFVRLTENKDEVPAYGDNDLELTEIPAGLVGAVESISNKQFRKAVMEMYSACFKGVLFESKAGNARVAYRNKIYKAIEPITKGFFRDENWEGVRNVRDAIKNAVPDCEVSLSVIDGGYGNHNEVGMPTSKTYQISIETPMGFSLNGTIVCSGAGTVDDPFDKYDITVMIY